MTDNRKTITAELLREQEARAVVICAFCRAARDKEYCLFCWFLTVQLLFGVCGCAGAALLGYCFFCWCLTVQLLMSVCECAGSARLGHQVCWRPGAGAQPSVQNSPAPLLGLDLLGLPLLARLPDRPALCSSGDALFPMKLFVCCM